VKKLVVASTTMVYGAGAKNPNYLDEDTELPQSRTPFLGDKIGAERQVARFAAAHPEIVVTVLRVAPTLGPTVQNFVAAFFSRPVAPAILGFDPLLQLVHEDDVADAFKLAVDEDAPGVYNIAGDGVLPYSTVRALMGKLTLPLPHFVARPLARALWTVQVADAPAGFVDFMRFMCVADTARARRKLGFAPRYDIRATINDFLGVSNDEITGRTASVRRA
jgi:UDP-glucose 4-epimerase